MGQAWPLWLIDRDIGIYKIYVRGVCIYRHVFISTWKEREMQMGFPIEMGDVVHPRMEDALGVAGHRKCGGGAGGTTLLPSFWCDRQLHPFLVTLPFQAQKNERESIRQKLALGSFFDDGPGLYTSCSKSGKPSLSSR